MPTSPPEMKSRPNHTIDKTAGRQITVDSRLKVNMRVVTVITVPAKPQVEKSRRQSRQSQAPLITLSPTPLRVGKRKGQGVA